MNKELLFQLYKIFSPSKGEKKMRKFVKRYIRKNCGECVIEQDAYGNVFVRKGVAESYPCVVSHLDQVQYDHSKDFEVVEGSDVVFGYSAKSRQQQGLGADDKNGIWICLECLQRFDVLKVAFFVGEEIGCVGSRGCDLGFFKDCRYIIQPDRRGGSDLITSMSVGKVCSDDFVNAISAATASHGYKTDRGTITDVGELVERGVGVSCINLSCGYYEAHTDTEFTILSELQNCLDLVCDIISTLTDSYPYVYTFARSYGYGGYGGYSFYERGYKWNDDWRSKLKSPAKVIEEDEREIEEYNDSYYAYCDEDYDMMENVIECNKGISFDELMNNGWKMNFLCRDLDVLRDIYNDVCMYYGYDTDERSSGVFWDGEDDDDAIGTLSFDDVKLRKVS